MELHFSGCGDPGLMTAGSYRVRSTFCVDDQLFRVISTFTQRPGIAVSRQATLQGRRRLVGNGKLARSHNARTLNKPSDQELADGGSRSDH